jgi:hypothetical protein
MAKRGDNTAITEDQEDQLGRDIDTLDNLAHALLLAMPADFHVRQLKSALPEVVAEMKKHYAEAFGWNPWEFHPVEGKNAGRNQPK